MSYLSKLSKILDESLDLVTNSLQVMNQGLQKMDKELEQLKNVQEVESKTSPKNGLLKDLDIIEGEFKNVSATPNVRHTRPLSSLPEPIKNSHYNNTYKPVETLVIDSNDLSLVERRKRILGEVETVAIDSNHFCSYGEWQRLGYQVKKGSKGYRKNGQVGFYFSQVVKKKNNHLVPDFDDDIPF